MTILESSNLIFAIFGRAADSNTAAILAANNDKNAAINTLLSSGAGFQSNAELVSPCMPTQWAQNSQIAH